jgi:hypothetical protein
MKPIVLFSVAAAALGSGPALHAQTVASTGDFTIERVLTLASIVAPTAPNFPPPVLAGLQAGAIEIHQVFAYSSAKGTVEQTAFVVPGNSPVPFPNPSAAPLADHYIVQVDASNVTSSPSPSVVLIGHVTSNDVATPWGNITGAGITISFGYRNTGSSVQFGPIIESVSPVYGLYTAAGAGSLSLTPSTQQCSVATLNGTYMFQLGGAINGGFVGFAPYWESGLLIADGKGGVTVLDSGNIGGSPFSGRTFTMSYTLDGDCQGTLSSSGLSMDFQVSKDAGSITFAVTKPSTIVANGSGRIQ